MEFELADLLYTKAEMSNRNVDTLMELWAAEAIQDGRDAPFEGHEDLLETIDCITHGDAPWDSFEIGYTGTLPANDIPTWMLEKYQVYHRDPREVVKNILSNRDFDGDFDYAPYREFRDNDRRWSDFMSGNWCWKQAVSILSDVLSANLYLHI